MAKLDSIQQQTILNPISCYGIGVHSGKTTQLTLKPAKDNTGIVFIRTDMRAEINFIEAAYFNVVDTALSTTIGNSNNAQVSTIEHLMAAIWACRIDNIIVEIDGPEVPIMDGSAKPFIWMIECSGIIKQRSLKKHLKILKTVKAIHKDCELVATKADSMSVDLTIDFASKAIGRQSLSFTEVEYFKHNIADARTFGFVHELEYMQSKGLAQGASLDNAIGIDQDTILNHDGLRYKDEFVRHKLLDLIGDFNSAGGHLIGSFFGHKTSHALNNQFLRQLFSDPTCYKWTTVAEL